jgi:Ni/Co efflux regulator RcnB
MWSHVAGPTLSSVVTAKQFRDYILEQAPLPLPVTSSQAAAHAMKQQPQQQQTQRGNSNTTADAAAAAADQSQDPAASVDAAAAASVAVPYPFWCPAFGQPDLAIVWERFHEHFKTNDVMKSASQASKSHKLSNSKSLESLSPAALPPTSSKQLDMYLPTATGGNGTANALTLASSRSPRGTQTNLQINAAGLRHSIIALGDSPRSQAEAQAQHLAQLQEHLRAITLTGELLSFCKTMLLKPDAYMSDIDYLKLCDSFELERMLTISEMQCVARSFWIDIAPNTAGWVAPASVGRPGAGSAAQTGPAASSGKQRMSIAMKSAKQQQQAGKNHNSSSAELEALLSNKQLNKFEFLLWLLDLEPLLISVNLLNMVTTEFGGNKALALRSFTEILTQSFSSAGSIMETELFQFLQQKLNIRVEPMSLLAIALQTLFRKLGRPRTVSMSQQQPANTASPVTVPGLERDACAAKASSKSTKKADATALSVETITIAVTTCVCYPMELRVFVEQLQSAADANSEDVCLLPAHYQETQRVQASGPNSLHGAASSGMGMSGSVQISRLNSSASSAGGTGDSTVASRLNSTDPHQSNSNSNPVFTPFSRQVSGVTASSMYSASEDPHTNTDTSGPQTAGRNAAMEQLLADSAAPSPIPSRPAHASSNASNNSDSPASSSALSAHLQSGKGPAVVLLTPNNTSAGNTVRFPAWKTLPTSLPGEPSRASAAHNNASNTNRSSSSSSSDPSGPHGSTSEPAATNNSPHKVPFPAYTKPTTASSNTSPDLKPQSAEANNADIDGDVDRLLDEDVERMLQATAEPEPVVPVVSAINNSFGDIGSPSASTGVSPRQPEGQSPVEADSAIVGGVALREGARVEANYRGGGDWYKGTVSRVRQDGTVDLVYDDGESEHQVPAERIRALLAADDPCTRFGEGDRLEANYRGHGKWFSGRVAKARPDGTYDVSYDGGEFEMRVPFARIRSVPDLTDSPAAVEHQQLHSSTSEEGIHRFGEGVQVEANYRGRGKWLRGKIVGQRPNGTFDVSYEDGEEEARIPLTRLRSPRDTDEADVNAAASMSPRSSGSPSPRSAAK